MKSEDMRLREVEELDAPQIADIYNTYVANTTVTFDTEPFTVEMMEKRINDFKSAGHPFFVVENKEKRIVGYCYAHSWKSKAAYASTLETTIYIESACRHNGLGNKMMECLINQCRKCGCHSLIACITAENVESIHFHERLGFKKVSCFKEVGKKFGRYLDVIDFQLLLK